MRNANEFMEKFTETKPGTSFVYYKGDIATYAEASHDIKGLRDTAYRLATSIPPKGFLTQRAKRNGFEYIFTKSKEIVHA